MTIEQTKLDIIAKFAEFSVAADVYLWSMVPANRIEPVMQYIAVAEESVITTDLANGIARFSSQGYNITLQSGQLELGGNTKQMDTFVFMFTVKKCGIA